MRPLFSALFLMLLAFSALAEPVPQPETVEEPEADTDNAHALLPPSVRLSPQGMEDEMDREMESESIVQNSFTRIQPKQQPQNPVLEKGYNTVVLQAINKVTARVSTLEITVGNHLRFGTLDINPRSCWRTAPGTGEENTALLDMYDVKAGEPPKQVFLGWIFSSSPALSALQHPFYDITLLKCEKKP